jgi:hypothetical protein
LCIGAAFPSIVSPHRIDTIMKSSTKRALAPLAVAGALVLTGVPPASADHQEPTILATGLGCPNFQLGISSTGSDPLVRKFEDKEGNVVRTISVGNDVILTYTNYGTGPIDPETHLPEAGKTISFKTAGSVTRTRVNDDGTTTVTQTGHNGLILFPNDLPEGVGPSATQYAGGRTVFTIDKEGIFTSVSTSGKAVDICAALE